MAIEKILVGDDDLFVAKSFFANDFIPFRPNVEIEFVDNPDDFIQKAKTGDYSMIITDLNYNYSPCGKEGFKVLELLKDLNTRKILWTGNADDEGIKEKGQSFGAEVLNKNELSVLVGQKVKENSLKENGDVLIYFPGENSYAKKSLEKSLGLLFDKEKIIISSDHKAELVKGQYGLAIDASPRGLQVAHDLKYLKLKEDPKIISVKSTDLIGIVKIIGEYFKK